MAVNKKILILELGGIGDAVMSLPAIEAVLNHFKNTNVDILTVSRTKPVIENLKRMGFDNFHIFTTDVLEKGGLSNWLGLIKNLRKQRYDIIIDLSAVETFKAGIKRWLFIKLIGAKETIGRDTDGRGWAFAKKVKEELTSNEHEVERKINTARLAGADIKEYIPNIEVEGSEGCGGLDDFLKSNGKIILGINVGAYRPSRRWPIDKVIVLAKDLLQEKRFKIVFLGGEREKEILQQIEDSLIDCKLYIRIAVNLSFANLINLLKHFSVFITNDTGLMHIAAALNVPMVITFDQNNVCRYRPYMDEKRYIIIKKHASVCPYYKFKNDMQECRRYSCDMQECMELITVDEVKEAVRGLLSRCGGNVA